MKIEWYPGHMAKARRQIIEVMATIDVVIEVIDARLPASSSNPLLAKLRGVKPCIKILNKNDLADPEVTRAWVRHFEEESNVRALPLEAKQRTEVAHIPTLCRGMVSRPGKPWKSLRVMVMGIPNVGKSTLINTLAGKRMARIGDKPAITTCPQQIDLRNGIFLSDTPGLLWPVMSDQRGAYRLATSGAIGDSAIDYADVALFAVAFMMRRYPELLCGRYDLKALPESPTAALEEIGRRRGCLVGGGEINLQRAGEAFLRDLRGGRIGRVSLEEPGEELVVEAAPEEGNGYAPL